MNYTRRILPKRKHFFFGLRYMKRSLFTSCDLSKDIAICALGIIMAVNTHECLR